MTATLEQRHEALSRAASGTALTNYPAIYAGFIDKGIAEADIQPRVNVFTYNAWQALGRQVRKGEHGVKVCTYISKPLPLWTPREILTELATQSRRLGRQERA